MITARVTKENEWQKNEIESFELDFETIGEIENYLAYNRGYIKAIEFNGKIEIKED